MGYFGGGSFENDDALDWLGEVTPRNAVTRIRKALTDAVRYSPSSVRKWTKQQIALFVESDLEPYQSGALSPPEDWNGSVAEFVNKLRRESQDYVESERYIDEQYGPMELAIAAAEIVAIWGGREAGIESAYAQPAVEVCKSLRAKKVPVPLLELARDAIRKVLANKRYRRMRSFYLEAFPRISGGDDNLLPVKDLQARLGKIGK